MQTVQTVNEKVVDLYPYKFSVSETKDMPPVVVVAVISLDGRDFDSNDSASIKSIFNDIEKWESFVQSVSVIVEELHLGQPKGIQQNFQYSQSKYTFNEDKMVDETLRRFYVLMNSDERRRREAFSIPRPTSAEIATAIENVGKWRSLADTTKLLRSLTE